MKKMIMLINVLMKNAQNTTLGRRKGLNKKNTSVGMIILYVFLFLYFGAIAVALTMYLFDSLKPFNQEGIIISMVLVLVTLLTLIFSIFSCINVYYLSSDIEYLLPLPLKPYEILLGKFAVLTIYNYVFEFSLAIPSFVIYGILNHESILFYIYSILILFIVPIIPLIIASLIVMILMSFVNLTKHRDKFVMLISIFAIGFAILINVFSSRMVPTDQENAMALLYKVNSYAILFAKAFPFILPSINCLVNALSINALLNFVIYLLINICAMALFTVVGNALYFKGALGSKETSSKKKLLTESEINKEITSKGKLFTFVLKEWRLLYRNPTYLMQCVAPVFIFPVLFFVVFKFNSQYKQLFSLLSKSPDFFKNPLAYVGLICILIFFLIGNTSSGSAISRDGSYATIAKYIPMDFYKQFIGKIILGCIFSVIEVVLTMLAFSSPLKLTISNAVFIIIIISLVGIIQNYIMLIIDLKRPKLIWDNETSVVKNNVNIFIDMIFLLVNIVLVFAIGFSLNLLSNIINASFINSIITITLIIVHVLIWVLLDVYVRKNKVNLFSSIE